MRERPPLGVPPEWVHEHFQNTNRVDEILGALKRYADAGLPAPMEWLHELDRRIEPLRALPPRVDGEPAR